MTTPNILPYQPTSSPPTLPGSSSSPTDRIHGTGKLRSFFESVRHDDPSSSSQPKPGNHGHRSAAHHRNTGFGSGPPSSHIGPGPPPPNLHLEYERIMGKKPMSPRTLHAAEAAALALDPAARMAQNQQQQQRVHTVPSRSSLVKSQFGSSIPNLQSIYPATRSSILASGPGLAGPASAKGKGTSRSRSGSNNSSMSGSSRRRNGTDGGQYQAHNRHASTDSRAYQQQQQPPMIPYPPQAQYQGQHPQQQPIWMSSSPPPPMAPSVINKIHSAHQSRSNSLSRQQAPGSQDGYMYPSSAPAMQDWQQQQAYFAQQQQQQQYMMQQYQQQQMQMQQQIMYQPSPSPQAAAAAAAAVTKKAAPKSKHPKSMAPPPQLAAQPQPAPPQPPAPPSKRAKGSPPPPTAQPVPAATSDPPANKPARGPPPEGFVACTHCGRSFAPDRVAKHETICLKTANSKRAPVDMSQVRKELIARDNVGGRQQGGGFG